MYFNTDNALLWADRWPSIPLTSIFEMCQNDDFARMLLQLEIQKYYIWNQSLQKFQRCIKGYSVPSNPHVFSTDAVGHIYIVHPSNDECFHLCLLLINIRDPTSVTKIQTVNGELYSTYRETYLRLKLLLITIISITPSEILWFRQMLIIHNIVFDNYFNMFPI